ncbi:hypothetical protein ACFPYI_15105 [Halomarina salina]|uniref:PASTA domain-containing protein n=1 Tax=Halomarina salina TaxID=1872699 RepID=A0ABD5RQA7_9EURY|nr:hypothetical protein [Halomarina salina]
MTDHQLGTTCERCGVHHRVVESMPNRPFAARDVARLDASVPFVARVGATETSSESADGPTRGDASSGDDEQPDDGADGDHDTAGGDDTAEDDAPTNTIVLSTAGATRLLRRAEAHGWVVVREREHADGTDPRAVGVDLFAEAAPDERLSGTDARTVLSLGE